MRFFRENKAPLLIVAAITLSFAVFLTVIFTIIHPNIFLSALSGDTIAIQNEKAENWKLIPISSNLFSFFTSGVSLSMFAPNLVKLLAHPSLRDSVKIFWPFVEIIILAGNVALFWFIFKKAVKKERVIIIYLALSMLATMLMIVIARPDHSAIPDFDYRYAGAAYYFYSIFIAICAFIAIKIKKEYAARIILPAIIIILSLQQVFSFEAVYFKEEARQRKDSIIGLRNNLLPELRDLGKSGTVISVPNLSGGHIVQSMPGYTLADYLFFFNFKDPIKLIQNAYMPPDFKSGATVTVKSLRSGTSPEFKKELAKPGAIRTYYSSPSWMIYRTNMSKGQAASLKTEKIKGKILVKQGPFNPEENNTLGFTLYTDNSPGNLYLSFSFKNDFGVEGEVGEIRIDDYTYYTIENNKRVYHIETDLLQIYAYALSEKISNLVLHIPEEKNAFVDNIYFR